MTTKKRMKTANKTTRKRTMMTVTKTATATAKKKTVRIKNMFPRRIHPPLSL